MSKATKSVALLVLLLISTRLGNAADPSPALQVPENFSITKVAGPPQINFPMFACFDDRGRLFVAESSGGDLYDELQKQTRRCRVSLLEDRDGDGIFEHAQIYVDKLVFPMGLAWRDGKLYVPDPPDLLAYEDTDNDGIADKRTVILTGFGHQDNGSLHGLTFGPDGLLYMTTGNPDGYKLKRADGSILTGSSGALLRCKADGSNPESLARGFENLVEVVFTPQGEIIGSDNWFIHPSTGAGLRDAIMHLVEGGLYPLHLNDTGTPMLVSGPPLPPIGAYPAVAKSGLMLYRGAAFPEAMRGDLFSAEHNSRKVVRHHLVREGSTFRSEDADFVTTDDPDVHFSDVLEDADGSLLVIDTGAWYIHHCPTGQIRKAPAFGGIYRVRDTQALPIDDPRGLKMDLPGASLDKLVELLSESRTAIRDRASEALVAKGEGAIAPLARKPTTGAVWVLSRIDGDGAAKALRDILAGSDPDLASAAARALARRDNKAAELSLKNLLLSDSPVLRMAAAESLAHCGTAQCVPALSAALKAEPDRFLEHALINALYHLAPEKDLLALLDDPHPRLQKAGLLLLDQPPHQKLPADAALRRASAEDESLRDAARQVLRKHPDWSAQAVSLCRDLLRNPKLSPADRSTVCELIIAFPKANDMASLVEQTIVDAKTPDDLRIALLETLSRANQAAIPQQWLAALRAALTQRSLDVRLQAARTIGVLQLSDLAPDLSDILADESNPAALRFEALRALIRRRPTLAGSDADLLLRHLARDNPPLTRMAAAEVLAASQPGPAQLRAFIDAVAGDPVVAPSSILSAAQRTTLTPDCAPELIDYLRQSLRRGWQLNDQQLAWLQSAVPADLKPQAEAVARELAEMQNRQREQLASFEPLLNGGDVARGRALFFGKASCSACHRAGPQGGSVGPDLTKIGAIRPGRDILESILLPSSTFAQGYEPYVADLGRGNVITGVRIRQTAETLVLRDASGAEIRLRNDQIKKLSRSKLSVMPEGLLDALTKDESRDLLAFLQSLK